MSRKPLYAIALALLCATPLHAQVITFEVDPFGAVPVDDAALGLASAYTVGPLSITFGIDGDLDGIPESPAFFERSGPDVLDGYVGCLGRDVAAPGFGPVLGGWFLRATPGADYGHLVISYAGGTVSGASGEIWDIDGVSQGTEQYRVKAYDSGGVLLATIDSPLSSQESGCANTELDSRPWTFNFSLTPGIARITVDFIGSKTGGIGLAFNNFNATGEVPVSAKPATWGRLKSMYR